MARQVTSFFDDYFQYPYNASFSYVLIPVEKNRGGIIVCIFFFFIFSFSFIMFWIPICYRKMDMIAIPDFAAGVIISLRIVICSVLANNGTFVRLDLSLFQIVCNPCIGYGELGPYHLSWNCSFDGWANVLYIYFQCPLWCNLSKSNKGKKMM